MSPKLNFLKEDELNKLSKDLQNKERELNKNSKGFG